MKIIFWQLMLFLIAISVANVNAASEGVGQVAQNLLEPVTLFSQLLQTACFAIGGAFLFAALIKYFEHKRSPLMTPFSTVVFLAIAGVLLILLPFLSWYTHSGMQYSLMN